jgi:hypothetical protein
LPHFTQKISGLSSDDLCGASKLPEFLGSRKSSKGRALVATIVTGARLFAGRHGRVNPRIKSGDGHDGCSRVIE